MWPYWIGQLDRKYRLKHNHSWTSLTDKRETERKFSCFSRLTMSLRDIIRLGLLNACYEVGFSIKCRDPNGPRHAGLLGVLLFLFFFNYSWSVRLWSEVYRQCCGITNLKHKERLHHCQALAYLKWPRLSRLKSLRRRAGIDDCRDLSSSNRPDLGKRASSPPHVNTTTTFMRGNKVWAKLGKACRPS